MKLNSRKIRTTLTILIILSLFVLPLNTSAFPGGVTGTSVASGCICHGGGSTSDEISIEINGLPEIWQTSKSYEIKISSVSSTHQDGENTGGFSLSASSGKFTSIDDKVQIIDGEATHTESGNNQREWELLWIAPSSGSQNTNIRVYVNSVNGDGSADSGDTWNTMTSTILGPELEYNDDWTDSNIIPIIIGFVSSMIVVNIIPHTGGMAIEKLDKEID